jgi:hypothetical protein
MKPKGLLIAVVLLAVLGGLYIWSNKRQDAAARTPAADTTTKLLTIPDDQFQEIRLKRGADTLALVRDNGKWRITAPQAYPADPDATSSLMTSLGSVSADKLIDDKATDLAQFGLDNPTLDVSVVRKDGKTNELLIGADTPTNSGSYAKLAGSDTRVFTVASFVKTGIDKSLNDLRDKRLMTFDQDKITRVQLQAKGPAVEFGKSNNNEWQILQPRPLRADSTQIDSLIGKLKDAKMDLANPDADAAKKFAGGTKIATATVTDSGGSQTLEVRQDKDHTYYAKSSAVEGVFKIPGDVGDAVNKSLDDFRNKKLFDFGFSDPTQLDIVNNGTASYSKSGDKWMSGGKTMDNSTVQTLIDRLRDLSADKFVEQGGGQPVFTASVTSNGGKRVEKVAITKQGEQYFAQRDGEQGIYELAAKSVVDLREAASGVKEQAPAPAAKKK